MNKTEVVSRIADYSNLSKRDAELALSGLIETVTNALAENQQVHITGFGTFKIKEITTIKNGQYNFGNKILLENKNKHDFRAGWKMNQVVDPNAIKPIGNNDATGNNKLAVLITLRSMIRACRISDLKRSENSKSIIKAIKLLPVNSYSKNQWLIAGQYLTDYHITASDRTGIIDQVQFVLTSAAAQDILLRLDDH